jgi:hypothetical protein
VEYAMGITVRLIENYSSRCMISVTMRVIVVLFDQHQFSYASIRLVIKLPYRFLPGS